jgi:hypothetical protein
MPKGHQIAEESYAIVATDKEARKVMLELHGTCGDQGRPAFYCAPDVSHCSLRRYGDVRDLVGNVLQEPLAV